MDMGIKMHHFWYKSGSIAKESGGLVGNLGFRNPRDLIESKLIGIASVVYNKLDLYRYFRIVMAESFQKPLHFLDSVTESIYIA